MTTTEDDRRLQKMTTTEDDRRYQYIIQPFTKGSSQAVMNFLHRDLTNNGNYMNSPST